MGHIVCAWGVDEAKDQSYVLHVLQQKHMAHTLFPIGEYPKSEVRAIAEKFGLISAKKKDSQDLCFLGDGDYRRFLNDYAPEMMKPGPIVLKTGEVIGEHQGLANYTIGQRKGLGIAYSEPLYVLATNPYRNALIVGVLEDLGRTSLTAHRVNWMSNVPPTTPFRAGVKIRYKAKLAEGLVTPLADNKMHIAFDTPLRDITAGQGAVVYDGDVCLGGGIILKED